MKNRLGQLNMVKTFLFFSFSSSLFVFLLFLSVLLCNSLAKHAHIFIWKCVAAMNYSFCLFVCLLVGWLVHLPFWRKDYNLWHRFVLFGSFFSFSLSLYLRFANIDWWDREKNTMKFLDSSLSVHVKGIIIYFLPSSTSSSFAVVFLAVVVVVVSQLPLHRPSCTVLSTIK